MRLVLITLQCCIIGGLYLVVAVPVVAATMGLAYFTVTAWEMVAMTAVALGLESAIYYGMMSLGAPPSTAGAPVLITAASALSTAATAIHAISAPFLLAVVVNLILGFLAYYRNWYKKLRRWATICNVVLLCVYVIPQLIILGFIIVDDSTPESIGRKLSLIALFLLLMLLWNSYFIVALYLWRRMPERPEIPHTLEKMPAMHIALWVVLAVTWAGVWLAAGFPLGFWTVFATLIILAAGVPLAYNAKAVKRIFAERKKRFALPLMAFNIVAALVCLVLVPPIGVALALSTVWLYVVLEMTFWPRPEPAGDAALTLSPQPDILA